MALASSACSGTTTFTDPLDQDDDDDLEDVFPDHDRHQHSDQGGSGSYTPESPSMPATSANLTDDTGSFLGKDSVVRPPTFWEAVSSLKIMVKVNFNHIEPGAGGIHSIEQEVIRTEKMSLQRMHMLMDEFITPLFNLKLIPEQYRKQITCDLPRIVSFHHILLDQLQMEKETNSERRP